MKMKLETLLTHEDRRYRKIAKAIIERNFGFRNQIKLTQNHLFIDLANNRIKVEIILYRDTPANTVPDILIEIEDYEADLLIQRKTATWSDFVVLFIDAALEIAGYKTVVNPKPGG